MVLAEDVLSRHDTFGQLYGSVPTPESAFPAAGANARLGPDTPLDSGNTLSMPIMIPKGSRGLARVSAIDFLAERLFSSAREVTLVVDGLPFHGVGSGLAEAKEDLLVAMEETIDELEADVSSGVMLSPHLGRALDFLRHVFGVQGD